MPGLRRKNGDRTEITGLVYLQPHLIENTLRTKTEKPKTVKTVRSELPA